MAEAKAWVMIPISKNKGTEIVIDIHPLVQCKDCKYGVSSSDEYMLCNKGIKFDQYKKPDWFCADGERR